LLFLPICSAITLPSIVIVETTSIGLLFIFSITLIKLSILESDIVGEVDSGAAIPEVGEILLFLESIRAAIPEVEEILLFLESIKETKPGAAITSSLSLNSNNPPSLVEIVVLPLEGENKSPADYLFWP
jgi:hypothetical protein